MFEAIHIENKELLIHSFRPQDVQRLKKTAADVYSILSDKETLRFLPEKRIGSVTEAEMLLRSSLLSFHAGKNYLHFITAKESHNIIGMIDIISPVVAQEHYQLETYPYFIEFYLKGNNTGKRIMTELLPLFVDQFQSQRKNDLGAVINRRNTAARKVLEKAGFNYQSEFGLMQDLFLISMAKQ
jgi:ribosomal-protein-alanine N-acetyltransferase